MSVRTLAKTPPGAGGGLLATGTYAGDGNATQAIVGVGFRPKLVIIYAQIGAYISFKTDRDGAFAYFYEDATFNWRWLTDFVISLDADGFTVGDGTPLGWPIFNGPGVTYTYVCFG